MNDTAAAMGTSVGTMLTYVKKWKIDETVGRM
jgi:hypothetical protein